MACNMTCEELSAFAAGDLEGERAEAIREHVSVCNGCQEQLRAFEALDAALSALRGVEPAADAILRTRRALSTEVRGAQQREIMTVAEAADFLRVSIQELECVLSELPVFEVGGRMRIRRSRLIEWIEKRERAYLRGTIQSEVAGIVAGVERIRL